MQRYSLSHNHDRMLGLFQLDVANHGNRRGAEE